MTQLIELVEVPAALRKIIRSETADLEGVIETIVVGAYIQDMDGTTGTFVPETKTVYLDLGNALNESALYNAGMMFIPNVWYTLLWAFGHEVEHGCQLEADPELIEFEKLPQEYEDMAMQAGEDLVLRWAQLNTIPPLEELGWLGKQLVVMLNVMYTKHPELSNEPHQYQLGAAATLKSVLALHEFTTNGKEVLIQEIDAGNIGLKIGNDRFLTAYEFLGL